MSKPILVGIGELLWDMLPTGKQLGGAPANFAYHVQSLGGRGIIVSSVGEDKNGQEIIDRLRGYSLNCDYIDQDRSHPTGTVAAEIDTDGNAAYRIRQDVAWDYIRQTPQLEKLVPKADAVIFGTLAQRSETSRETIRHLIRQTHGTAWCILDINLRPPFYTWEIIEASLPLAHILKLNTDELSVLAGMLSLAGDESALLSKLMKRYSLSLIALTRGEYGSILYSDDERSVHSGFETEVIDTVGAGDAFTAALALGMIEGHSLDTINEKANRLAAYVCAHAGATPPPDEKTPSRMRER